MPDLVREPTRTNETPAVETPTPEKQQPAVQPRGNAAAQEQVAAGGGEGGGGGLANYEAALGEFLGKKLFEAVSGILSYDKLSGSAKDAVKQALGALADQVGKLDGVTADPKALDNLGTMLDAAASPHIDKLLEKYGPELTGKLAKWTGAHPRTVLSVALLAAAGAVLANAPIPELAKQFKLGKGLTLDVEANLGKLRQIALEKLKAKLSYEAGPLVASIEADKDGNVSGSAGLKVGQDDKQLALDAKFDNKGLKVVGLDGVLKPNDQTEVKGHVGQERDKKAIGTVLVTRKDGSTTTTQDFGYDANTGVFQLGQSALFEDGGVKFSESSRTASDGTGSVDLGVEAKKGNLSGNASFSHSTTQGAYGLQDSDKLKLGLAYKRSDLTAQLDAQLSSLKGESKISGSVEKSWGNSKAGASLSAVLDDPKLLEVGAFYGFKDPKEFKSFLLEYKHKGATSENALALSIENTLGDVRLRWQQSLTWGGQNDTKLDTRFQGAKFLDKDTALLAGMEHSYNFSTGKNSFTPQVGVQYKGLPVMVGYDMEKKAVKVGITIPF